MLPTLLTNTTKTAQYLKSQLQRVSLCLERRSSFPRYKADGLRCLMKIWVTHPAAAAKISCRLALVNNERMAENMRVDTRSTPRHVGLVADPLVLVVM